MTGVAQPDHEAGRPFALTRPVQSSYRRGAAGE
jgi:hypothetical protein